MKIKTVIETKNAGDWEFFDDGESFCIKIDGCHPFKFSLEETNQIVNIFYNLVSIIERRIREKEYKCSEYAQAVPINITTSSCGNSTPGFGGIEMPKEGC